MSWQGNSHFLSSIRPSDYRLVAGSLDQPTGCELCASASRVRYCREKFFGTIFKCVIGPTPEDCKRPAIDLAVQNAPTGYSVSFLLSKLSSISTLLGSRRKICQRALLGTWFTWYGTPFSERCRFVASKPRQPKAT